MKLKNQKMALFMPSCALLLWALLVCAFWPVNWMIMAVIAVMAFLIQLVVWLIRPMVVTTTSMPVMLGCFVGFVYTTIPQVAQDDKVFSVFCFIFAALCLLMFLLAILVDIIARNEASKNEQK